MCRSIKRLHNVDPPVKADEVRNASLQFVRKIAGTTRPSKANAAAFDRAVDEIAAASERLLAALVAHAPAQDREAFAAKARASAGSRGSDDLSRPPQGRGTARGVERPQVLAVEGGELALEL